MPATFTITGTLEGDTASSRSVYVQYTTDVTNPTEDLNYGLPRRVATTDGTFMVDDLAAWDPLNLPYDAGAPQHGFVISSAGRYKWVIPAQVSGATVDVADFTDAWVAPLTPSEYLTMLETATDVAADRVATEAAAAAASALATSDGQTATNVTSGPLTGAALNAALGTAVTLTSKGADPTGAAAADTQINSAITDALTGKVLRPTFGTYKIDATATREIAIPGGGRFSLLAERGARLKIATGSMTSDNQIALGVSATGGDVESVDIDGFSIDMNRRGQSLPAGTYDWQHNAALRIGSAVTLATDRLGDVRVNDFELIDPVADGVQVASYYVDSLLVKGMRVRGRAGTRSDICLSKFPKFSQISDFVGSKIEAEPVTVPAGITNNFVVQINNAICDQVLDLEGVPIGDRTKFQMTSVKAADMALAYASGYLRGGDITYPLSAWNGREMKYLRTFTVEDVDFWLTADASDVVAPLKLYANTSGAMKVKFKNCRYHIVSTTGHTSGYTGPLVQLDPQPTVGSIAVPEYDFDDCWFDELAETSIKIDRAGIVRLKNNSYGGTAQAIDYVQSATLPLDLTIDGADMSRVTGSFFKVASVVGGSLTITPRTAVPAGKHLHSGTGLSTLPTTTIRNSRVVYVTADPTTTPIGGLRGDRARLESPVGGAAMEWICQTSHISAATWVAVPAAVTSEQVLATVTGIDAKTTGTTNLYTVPTGRTAVITRAVIRTTTATAITVPPTLGIGVAAGEQDMFASVALTGLTSSTNIWEFSNASGLVRRGFAADVIKLGIDTGATATTMTISVDLIGYLI